MSKLLRVLVFLGALVLVLAVMALLGVRSSSRSALQRYERELRAKGEKLTFAELTRGRQPNAVDSHALLTNAVAKLDGARFHPGSLEQRRYARPGQVSVFWRQASLPWGQLTGPGDRGTWEEFAAQMQAAQGTLRDIREALKQPAADAGPATNMLFAWRVNFDAIRTAAHWLRGATENNLHQGRLEEALQDLEAFAALARMEQDEYTLVAQMIRVGVASLGLTTTWEALQAPGWTEPQLERLQKAWEPVDLVEAVEKDLVGERAGGYELFAMVRRSSGPQAGRTITTGWNTGSPPPKATFEDLMMGHVFFPFYKLTSIDADELSYLETMQGAVVALRLSKAHRPWREANQAVTNSVARVNQLVGALDRIRHYISLMSIPNYTRAGKTAVHTETERQMTLAAIALKRFQLRHGQLPPTLEALVPELLPAVPYDYMSAKPLVYRLKADGSYLLYSVGDDGKDDGGDPTLAPSASAGLWGGRDVVWPSPVTEAEQPPRQPDR